MVHCIGFDFMRAVRLGQPVRLTGVVSAAIFYRMPILPINARMRPSVRIALAVFAGLLFAAAFAGGVFFVRRPIVIVSDQAFELLYGKERNGRMSALLSVRAFRPVRTAIVAADAAPASAADAAAEAAGARGAAFVLFPERYDEGARVFAARARERFSSTHVALIGTSQSGAAPFDGVLIQSDYAADGRAVASAVLDLASRLRGRGTVLFRLDGPGRDAFIAGFQQAASVSAIPLELVAADAAIRIEADRVLCLVSSIWSADLEAHTQLGIPLVLITWLDRAFLPGGVIATVDDSPYALAYGAYRLASRGESGPVPSTVHRFRHEESIE